MNKTEDVRHARSYHEKHFGDGQEELKHYSTRDVASPRLLLVDSREQGPSFAAAGHADYLVDLLVN